jgi:hypothetical protein
MFRIVKVILVYNHHTTIDLISWVTLLRLVLSKINIGSNNVSRIFFMLSIEWNEAKFNLYCIVHDARCDFFSDTQSQWLRLQCCICKRRARLSYGRKSARKILDKVMHRLREIVDKLVHKVREPRDKLKYRVRESLDKLMHTGSRWTHSCTE